MKMKLRETNAFRILIFAALIFILAGCGGKTEPSVSAPSENNAGQPVKGEITLTTYYEDAFLNEAAKIFSEQNPDTPVKINVYKPVDGANDTDAVEMYVTYINTALASGTADDILVMSNLPYYRYSDSLTDLAPYMQTGFSEQDYITRLFKVLDENGKRYTLPIDFYMEMFAFHEDYAEHFGSTISFSACNEIGRNLIDNLGGTQNFSLYNYDGFSLFFNAFSVNYHRLIDFPGKKSNLKNGELLKMFNDFKNLENDDYIPTSQEFFDMEIPDNYLAQYSSTANLTLLIGYDKPFTETALITGEGGEVYYGTFTQLGINDSSKNKEAAWQFVAFLLSEQMQSSPQLPALPINKNALRQSTKRELEEMNQTRKANGMYINEDLDSLTNAAAEKIESWASRAQYFSYFEPIVTNVVFEEGYDFFLGNSSAEDVINIIDNKISLYLAE
ncbi:MAG: extracellular solute-binding protein [Clostridiales bacterium]|jgi:multiple sugar transport system substrate-binding protein|nr:extracellular solute-binding protein [Clostridiales bacterium]